uniref:Uncharacterized protein n=1 Tax=Anopheles farauti TaxID=69004 RepID=A0A182Q5K8_9DIPT
MPKRGYGIWEIYPLIANEETHLECDESGQSQHEALERPIGLTGSDMKPYRSITQITPGIKLMFCPSPIGASIVAMCPKNVGLHTNPALAMCKPTFEVRPPTVQPMMLVPRDSSYKPTVTTPTSAATGLGNAASTTNNNNATVTNNNKPSSNNGTDGKLISTSNSQNNIVRSTSGQLANSVSLLKSNGTTTAAATKAESQGADGGKEKSFL